MKEEVHVFENNTKTMKIVYSIIVGLLTSIIILSLIIHENTKEDLITAAILIIFIIALFAFVLKSSTYKLSLYTDRLEISKKVFGNRIVPYQYITNVDIQLRSIGGNAGMFIIFFVEGEKEINLPYDNHKEDFEFISKYIKNQKHLLIQED